ncbi:MAG: hypothetical protein AVDCRST_MAG38-2756 [uncultured Solirubrobacteraceae bacterium]|uniref:Flippase-like domain-containing protein n=1 Tax=uncultured Solirubrobacteraceae bacterium TaxID=1162706 RepID=A0A6J4SG01_9ACTN|nr:MAG: hypothetical protein AVDCRST_MAG38-2756 [uncultured Solirubrobacteraceae bacterium]
MLALAGVVWWALRQEPPRLPATREQLAALLLAVALYALATVVRAERWHALLAADGARPPRVDSYALTVVGYAANNVLPARAGDAVRVMLMAPRAGTSRRTVIGTLLAERLLDVAVVLMLFAIVGYGVLGAIRGASLGLALGLIAAVAVVAAGVLALLWRRDRAQAFLAPILSSTMRLRTRLGALMLLVTIAIWAIEAAVWMAVGSAVGFGMDPIEGTYLVALASVFALIPSGPGYAGTQDAAAVIGIKALGGSGAVAVAYLVTLRFVIVVPITVAGLALAAARYGGVRRLRAAGREAPA